LTSAGHYDRNVFINCPFDKDYEPVLQAILFCVIDCGLSPRLSTERADSGEARLDKIVELIRSSRFTIHDLSRVQAAEKDEFARLNMPFELGIDYGFANSGNPQFSNKHLLVVAEERYKYQVALSDIAGWDIRAHNSDFEEAIKQVRGWLASHNVARRSSSQIIGDYVGFQEWDYERRLADGWNDADIQERGTPELLKAMGEWLEAGRPTTF